MSLFVSLLVFFWAFVIFLGVVMMDRRLKKIHDKMERLVELQQWQCDRLSDHRFPERPQKDS